jgi:acyl-coenzyme A synthetase/AMP-(fatty) acid ligase
MFPGTVRLAGVLRDGGGPIGDALVAFGPQQLRSRDELLRHVAGLAAAIAKAGPGRWLVHTEDAFAAAVALLALASQGATALMAPNRQEGTLRRLARGARGSIVDASDRLAMPPLATALAPLGQPAAVRTEWREPARDAPLAEFWTSGTTGEGRSVAKAWRHLEDEVATLEALFGGAVSREARVFATVSHQHIYGLLFRVLWPLATGRPFQAQTLLHTRELLPRMAGSDGCVLVTSPAHLKRMTAAEGLRSLRGVCQAVFSSGGLLDAETAARTADQLGAAPFEILGSTETGGVALRQRGSHDDAWRPFPGVEVEREAEQGRLVVTSPFVSVGERRGDGRRRFVMGDRIETRPDGSFLLGERADRTVKIAGKRLSLPDMEAELERHPAVSDAALVVLELAGEPRVHAVVVPTAQGYEMLRRLGRRGLGATLAAHLAECFDRVLLPRAWRIRDELPRNAQGKLPVEALRSLFEGRERDPTPLGERRGERTLERRLEVPSDLAHLEGHFEGLPLVAGVVQLRWVMAAAAELLSAPPGVRAIEALKFPDVLRPGDQLTLRVELSQEADRLRFRLYDGERTFATGRCVLGPAAGSPP